MEKCYNYNCPFKKVSSDECECFACPNRCVVSSTYYTSNRTLSKEELTELELQSTRMI